MSISGARTDSRRALDRTVLIVVAVQVSIALAVSLTKLDSGSEDTDIYRRYAAMVLEGRVPYRDFRIEYPPLALPLFLMPGLISLGVVGYRIAFAAEMLLVNAATVRLVADWVERRQGPARVRSRLAWYTVFFALMTRLIVSRFDAAPMLLGFAASIWWFSGRGGLGGATAALGALMKVYPATIVVVAAAWDLTRSGTARGRGLAGFILASSIGLSAWIALGTGRGVWESLGFQLERGFEYGSLYSGLQMLAAKVLGAPIAIVWDHAAWSSTTPWSTRLSALVFPLQASAILMVCAVFIRRGMTDGVRYSGAVILAFIIMGKVFSPQFLIWLIPFIAVLERPVARRASWIFAAGCAASLLAPGLTGSFPRTSAGLILAYNVKNALFLWLLVVLVWGPSTGGHEAATGRENRPPAPTG
jgi:Glycosyltransferase family 87